MAGFSLFAPWFGWGLIYSRKFQVGDPAQGPAGLARCLLLVKGWLRSFSLVFIDFNLNEQSGWLSLLVFLAVVVALVLLTLYAALFLWRHAPDPRASSS